MSWITIKRDNETFTVPYDAFKDVYEKHGFVELKVENSTHKQTPKVIKQETVVEKKENENVQYKPKGNISNKK